MTSTFNLHRTIAFVINVLIIGLILYTVIKDGSDKSPIIFMVFYPALTILNLIITVVLSLFKMTQAKIYKQIVIGQLLLFIPLVMTISQF
jgi:heme A synthase